MKTRGRSYFDLIRLPNVVGAVADPLAGFLFVGGGLVDWTWIAPLIVASILLYSGGMVLNDVCDAERDARVRPERPIPSGYVSRSRARLLAVSFLAGGLLVCTVVSRRSTVVGTLLVVCIILYDAVWKNIPIAPALMGSCRALNLLLGASAVIGAHPTPVFVPAGLIALYVTSVTYFAREEAGTSSRARIRIGTAGVVLAVVGLVLLPHLTVRQSPGYLLGVVLLAGIIGRRGLGAAADLSPRRVQVAVKTYLTSLILFDAMVVWAVRGWMPAALVSLLLLPVTILARRYRVT